MDLYDYLISKKGVRISEVLTIFVPKIMETKRWEDYDTFETVYNNIRDSIIERIRKAVDEKGVPGKIKYAESSRYCDEYGAPLEVVDTYNSFVRTTNVVNWAITEGYLQRPGGGGVVPSGTTVEKVEDFESFDDVKVDEKYPDFRGLSLNDISEEKLYALKKAYGQVKDAESKYRRGLQVAVKVGLLFYERSLGKPTTKPEFLAAYKEEFDSFIKNDLLAKEIYNYLPEEYRGSSSSSPGKTMDILPIIKAAVYAGSIYDTDDAKKLNNLKRDLVENEYDLPTDDILERIIEAVKDI